MLLMSQVRDTETAEDWQVHLVQHIHLLSCPNNIYSYVSHGSLLYVHTVVFPYKLVRILEINLSEHPQNTRTCTYILKFTECSRITCV